MNDIRRTILWVIFGFSMVLLWDQWQIHNGNKPTFFGAPAPKTDTPAAGAQGAVPNAATPAAAAPGGVTPATGQRVPASVWAGPGK